MNVRERLFAQGIVPVVVIDNAKDAVPLAKTMYNNGIKTIEITFRTESALEAVKNIAIEVPEMLVGAGTIMSVEMVKKAVSAGAEFIVMAGLKADVVKWCIDNEIPIYPGVTTPTEIMTAVEFGLKDLKFFPAEQSGGAVKLKAFSSPFSGITFMPTGGITKDNIMDYLNLPNVEACGGSWICPRNMIIKGEFEKIGNLCKEAIELTNNSN